MLRATIGPYGVVAKRATCVERTNGHKFILHEACGKRPAFGTEPSAYVRL